MSTYEINVLRTNGTCEIYRDEFATDPVPPESGDEWALGAHTILDLPGVACIEIVGVAQPAKPWHVWGTTFDFAVDAETRTYRVEGDPALPPEIPGSGTWWAVKASRGDEPACDSKNDLFLRRGNLLSITTGASPTTCP